MFFREVLNEDLGCASYMVADGGEAVIIDPKWEVDQYLQAAKENGFRISHILETHNHADYLSGKRRLAKATGAKIHISKDAGVEYEHESLEDGDVLELGSVRIVAVARSGGIRSLLAASLLKRSGIEDVEHVADGGVPMLSNEDIELVEGT